MFAVFSKKYDILGKKKRRNYEKGMKDERIFCPPKQIQMREWMSFVARILESAITPLWPCTMFNILEPFGRGY